MWTVHVPFIVPAEPELVFAAPENSRFGSDIERVILLMRFLLQVFTSFETIGREESAKIAQLYLIDVLFNEYCSRDLERTIENRAKTSNSLRSKLL